MWRLWVVKELIYLEKFFARVIGRKLSMIFFMNLMLLLLLWVAKIRELKGGESGGWHISILLKKRKKAKCNSL